MALAINSCISCFRILRHHDMLTSIYTIQTTIQFLIPFVHLHRFHQHISFISPFSSLRVQAKVYTVNRSSPNLPFVLLYMMLYLTGGTSRSRCSMHICAGWYCLSSSLPFSSAPYSTLLTVFTHDFTQPAPTECPLISRIN
jgi:hypothetical protein